MKIALYGAGNCGKYVISEIQRHQNPKIEIKVIIDNNPVYSGESKCGIPIVNLESFIDTYSKMVDSVLVTIWDELKAQELAVSLLNKDYNDIYLIPEAVANGILPVLNQSGVLAAYIKHINSYKPVLPYVEYHISDYCNLKCKGCGHFSNLVKDKIFPDINEFKNSLEGLASRFENVKRFRLMGGEPLVNPDLGLFICEARRAFPYSDIRVVTNGLLLPQISRETVAAIKACGVTLDISQYPPTRRMIEQILQFAQVEGLKIQIGSEITKFFKMIGSRCGMDAEMVYNGCISRKCHFLRKGRLYVCGAPALLFENKDFLGLNIEKTDVEEASFDLSSGKEDGWQILKKLLMPFDFCKYCTAPEWFDWNISGKEIQRNDWIIDSCTSN